MCVGSALQLLVISEHIVSDRRIGPCQGIGNTDARLNQRSSAHHLRQSIVVFVMIRGVNQEHAYHACSDRSDRLSSYASRQGFGLRGLVGKGQSKNLWPLILIAEGLFMTDIGGSPKLVCISVCTKVSGSSS